MGEFQLAVLLVELQDLLFVHGDTDRKVEKVQHRFSCVLFLRIYELLYVGMVYVQDTH